MTLNDQESLAGSSSLVASILSKRDAFDRANRISSEIEARNVYAGAMDSGDTILADAIQTAAESNGWDITISTGPAGAESTRARGLFVGLLNTLTAAPGQIKAGEDFTDVRLTSDAQAEERATKVKTTLIDLNSQTLGILTQLGNLSDKASARAAKVTPTLDLNDPGQLTRTAQAWEFIILPQLSHEVRPNWQAIIAGLDVDGLLALQRFAPAWIRADQSADPAAAAATINAVINGTNDAMAGAITDPNTRATITNAIDCANYLHWAEELSLGIVNASTSRDVLMLNTKVQNVAYMIGASTELVYPTAAPSRNLNVR